MEQLQLPVSSKLACFYWWQAFRVALSAAVTALSALLLGVQGAGVRDESTRGTCTPVFTCLSVSHAPFGGCFVTHHAGKSLWRSWQGGKGFLNHSPTKLLGMMPHVENPLQLHQAPAGLPDHWAEVNFSWDSLLINQFFLRSQWLWRDWVS
jgi:hypothetical protein